MNIKTVKKYASLAQRKYREKWQLFLAEGNHIVEELLKSDWEIESILTSGSKTFEKLNFEKKEVNCELVKQDVINKIATTKTPQEILAVVRIPQNPRYDIPAAGRVIITDGIKDPGNMGTIIRTARAFDFDLVITTENSVDIYNPKVVRASQGAIFGIGLLAGLPAARIAELLKPDHVIYALTPDGDTGINEISFETNSALIIGTEIEGVSGTLLDNCDHHIRIPHSRDVESLNAAVAAGVAMFVFNTRS